MKDKENKPVKKRLKRVLWMCDKVDCNSGNIREIPVDSVINDDICDYCRKYIHEPLSEPIIVP